MNTNLQSARSSINLTSNIYCTILKLIKENNLSLLKKIFHEHSHVAIRLIQLNDHTEKFCDIAVSNSSLKMLKFLNSNGAVIVTSTIVAAVQSGSFECFEYVYTLRGGSKQIMKAITKVGNLQMMKYAHEHNCPWDGLDVEQCIVSGSFECFKYALEHNAPWCRTETANSAVVSGDLRYLETLHQHGAQMNPRLCAYAASHGHLHVLNWLLEHECPMDSSTASAAASKGHFDVLKWVFEQGCPINSSTFNSAAEFGDSSVLEWLLECDCTWEPEIIDYAAARGHLHIIKWIETKLHSCTPTSRTLEYSCRSKSSDTLEYLVHLGVHVKFVDCITASYHFDSPKCFEYLFKLYTKTGTCQDFLNMFDPRVIHKSKIVTNIDLDSTLWRNIVWCDTRKTEQFIAEKIKQKYTEITENIQKCVVGLTNVMPRDLVVHVIPMYF